MTKYDQEMFKKFKEENKDGEPCIFLTPIGYLFRDPIYGIKPLSEVAEGK